MNLEKSNELKTKGSLLIPALSQTFSKSPSSFVEGTFPIYAKKGDGCYIYDVDENKYIDYLMALGPVVLGYNYKSVNESVIAQLKKGIIFSLPHELEIDAAQSLKKIIPCAEMTRFTKTGSDAVTGAVRAARAITKKDLVLYCGSGGVWDDWFSIVTNRNMGIPKFNLNYIRIFGYNDLTGLQDLFSQHKNQVATVIIEPTVYEKPNNNFLQEVKKITHENESLLIFDEILTGFRISKGGGQEYFGIKPDMATFAKGIANGLPLGAIVGKAEYMKIFNDVFVSTTYGGEALSLAACVATVNEFKKNDVIGHMTNLAISFKDGFNKLVNEKNIDAECIGYYPRLKLLIRDDKGNDSLLLKSYILQELIEKGIFMHPNTILFSFSHSKENVNYTLECLDDALTSLQNALNNGNIEKKIKGRVAKEVIKINP